MEDSSETSKIINTTIHGNFHVDPNQVNNGGSNLQSDKYLFGLISSSLQISDSSRIFNESLLLNAFMSTLVINETEISNINFDETSIRIVSSTLDLCHSQLLNINDESLNGSNKEFILIDDNGEAIVQNLELTNSNSMLLRMVTSFGRIGDLRFNSVHSSLQMIFIENSFNLSFSEISFTNFSSESEDIVHISRSERVTIDRLVADNSSSIVVKLFD